MISVRGEKNMKRIKRFLSRIAKRALDKFSDYKLKRKLILVNVAIAVFVGLAIGTLGVTDIISLGSMSLNIYNQDLVPSSSLNKIQSDFQSINIGIRDMALSANADGTSADVRSLNTDISKQLNIYAKQITAPDAKDNYELLKNEIQGYDEYQNSLLTTIQNGDVNGAIIYMNNAGKVLTDQLGETISDGSQSLSQGSAEQAGAIENLSSTIGRIAEKKANNAENANRVNQIFASARENIMHGSSQMQQMLEAMRSISESSTKISKIIKLIDDIAFQTNILAINATVEAARAGQAGRSFSVVAQEVKNLAERSANAASETSELIEKSKLDVEAGMKIAENTARLLNQIMSEMDKTAKHVDDISVASKEQATDIMNYNVNLEQISQAVQTNSATTEQSAAASQKLADQAATLKKMVGQFKLRSHDGDSDQS